MSAGPPDPARPPRRLLDDCFLHDRDRMRHDEVLALLNDRLVPLVTAQDTALDGAAGRYLAGDVAATRDVPLHDNSAVDGYAFAYADYARRNTLGIAGRIAAGELAPPPLQSGTAARIFTGAVMPEGADTVAMQEDCEIGFDGATVTVPKGLKPGANRRRAGEDVKAGAPVLSAGSRLRPQDVAALASLGLSRIDVHAPLKVALLSTGNELVEPGEATLRLGQVYDSNRAMLKALAATLPIEIADLGILPDDAGRIEETIAAAAGRHHVILSTGGASRGEEDHVVSTLDRLGKRHLWQIAVKPGRPMTLGQIAGAGGRDCLFFGLPGNPVAVFVCFLLYVRPALVRLGGGIPVPPQRYPLPAAFAIERKKKDRREFLRGWLADGEGRTAVHKFPRDGSGLISGLRAAEGLIELPEETESVAAGDTVSFIPFSAFGIGV